MLNRSPSLTTVPLTARTRDSAIGSFYLTVDIRGSQEFCSGPPAPDGAAPDFPALARIRRRGISNGKR